MIKAISDSTAIRSNGHAWCTADDNLCVGNGGLETTRCVNCDNAVIGRAHARLYQGLYDHLRRRWIARTLARQVWLVFDVTSAAAATS